LTNKKVDVFWYTVYIHFRGFLPPNGILSATKFTLRPILAFSYGGSVTAQHSSKWASDKIFSVVHGMELRNFRRVRHLYSAGRPSRWASSVNLRCRFENVLNAARSKCRTQKWCKKSQSAHHRTTLLGCIFATKAHIDNRKKAC